MFSLWYGRKTKRPRKSEPIVATLHPSIHGQCQTIPSHHGGQVAAPYLMARLGPAIVIVCLLVTFPVRPTEEARRPLVEPCLTGISHKALRMRKQRKRTIDTAATCLNVLARAGTFARAATRAFIAVAIVDQPYLVECNMFRLQRSSTRSFGIFTLPLHRKALYKNVLSLPLKPKRLVLPKGTSEGHAWRAAPFLLPSRGRDERTGSPPCRVPANAPREMIGWCFEPSLAFL